MNIFLFVINREMSDKVEQCFDNLKIKDKDDVIKEEIVPKVEKESTSTIKNDSSAKEVENHFAVNLTGLVYDDRMSKYSAKFEHPEKPERILRAYKKLLSSGLADKCVTLEPRLATKDEILLKHTEDHYRLIESLVIRNEDELDILSENFDDVYFHPGVSEAALLSAGCTLELVEQIIAGSVLNGAAVVRPPGHHALSHCSMGFCHFNNVALAAMLAITKHNLKRILIVDWDIHYGNATHKMFEDDPRVLYFSLHRYQYRQFWPHLVEANYDAVGIGAGEGYNVHVAWNKRGIRDCEYLFALDNLLIPIAEQYDPEIILVSCGFDSGDGDPLGGCKVSPAGYAHMTKKLMQFAGGKVAIVLEGGYNLSTIESSMEACVSTLLGNPLPVLADEEPDESPCLSVMSTFFAIYKYWNALEPFYEKNVILHGKLKEDLSKQHTESESSEDESEDFIKDIVLQESHSPTREKDLCMSCNT